MLSFLAIPLGIAPTLIWLFFYLKKDLHSEPRHMVALTFLGGMAIAPLALFAESGALEFLKALAVPIALQDALVLFVASALIEEFLKFAVVRFLVIHSRAFDEPVDGMVYLIIAALGFAAIENILILGPLLNESVGEALLTGLMRFWGANFLHALASGVVGYFYMRGVWGRGLLLGTLFHGFFNGAIVLKAGIGFPIIGFLLGGMAILVSIFLKRLLAQGSYLPLYLWPKQYHP